jgi:hypothetical protein
VDEYTLFVKANAQGFEAELRDAVESTSDAIANRLFHVEVRTPDDPDVLSIYMVATYPDEMVPSPPGFDWGESPKQEVVHGAIRCRVFSHGADNIRVGVVCADERAREYCTLLVQELDRRLPGALLRPVEVERTDSPEPLGAKAGTFERVREAHRLITKEHRTRTSAFKKARTDSRTYDRWCKEATGEEPAESG